MSDNLSRSIQSTEHELSWAGRGLKGNTAEDGKINLGINVKMIGKF